MIHPLSKKQPIIDDCQPRQLFQQSALRLSPKLLPCAKFTGKHQTLHSRFEVPQVPPLVLASTCVQVGFHVSCSCARFGVPNHGQSPTELGLNYVSAGLPNPLWTAHLGRPPGGRPTAPQELTPGGHQGTPWSSSEGGSMEAP